MSKQTFTIGQVLTAAQMTSLQQTAMGGGSTTAKTASYTLVAADAGTVVQMNSASSTTITVNTALFSAGDSVQIQNVGTGVCTVTAGTATVSTAGSLALSQYEGGQLYFNTTSAALFFDIVQSSGMTNPLTTTGDTIYSSSGTTPARLGIGSTGQVLTVASGLPSWATPAGGGGTVFINKTNFSAISSQSVNSVFTSTYDNYLLLITTTTGGGGDVDLRLRTGSDDSSSNYYSQSFFATDTTLGGARETAQTIMRLGTNSNSSLLNVTLGQPNVAAISTYTSFMGTNTTLPVINLRTGSLNTSTQYTGFTLLFGGSTTGSVSVYGLVKA